MSAAAVAVRGTPFRDRNTSDSGLLTPVALTPASACHVGATGYRVGVLGGGAFRATAPYSSTGVERDRDVRENSAPSEATGVAPQADKPPEEGEGSIPVVVSVPADKTYVVLIRSAISHLGARLGFTVAEITDLRLAVDEACGLLLAPDEGLLVTGASLRCRFEEMADGLRVTVSAAVTADSHPDTEGFGWSVLSALVDGLTWSMLDGTGYVELVKRPARQETR